MPYYDAIMTKTELLTAVEKKFSYKCCNIQFYPHSFVYENVTDYFPISGLYAADISRKVMS